MAVFALGSAACAVSWNAGALIAFRVLQGTGGAAMLALTLSIITETFPAATRAGAIGTWAAIGGTGFGVGPVVGGVLLAFFGWASIFWVNLPFAVVAIAVTMTSVRESRNPDDSRRLDGPGVAASALGLVAVTLGLTESASHPWGSWQVAAPLITGVAFLAGFARWERRTPHAMIPPALLRRAAASSAPAPSTWSATPPSAASLFYVTLLYQDVYGWSPLRTGLSWLLMNVPFLLTAQLAGGWTAVTGPPGGRGRLRGRRDRLPRPEPGRQRNPVRPDGRWLPPGRRRVRGPGAGVTHVAMRDVPAGASGGASGVVNAARQVGTSVGLAVLGRRRRRRGHLRLARDRRPVSPPPPGPQRPGRPRTSRGAHVSAVTQALGPAYRDAAAQAFTHGYHLAVGAGSDLPAGSRRHRPPRLSPALVPIVGQADEPETSVGDEIRRSASVRGRRGKRRRDLAGPLTVDAGS